MRATSQVCARRCVLPAAGPPRCVRLAATLPVLPVPQHQAQALPLTSPVTPAPCLPARPATPCSTAADSGASLALLSAGYNLDTLLTKYQGVDWWNQRTWGCNARCVVGAAKRRKAGVHKVTVLVYAQLMQHPPAEGPLISPC